MMVKIMDKSIDSAKKDEVVEAPVVVLQDKPKVVRITNTRPPVVTNEVIKIISECDPVKFLCDIVNGNSVAVHIVNGEGEVKTLYERPSLKQRIDTAKFLTNKYLPNVAVVKHAHLHKNEDGDKDDFSQMIENAANKA